jgi:rfaE bifunctional protein nucleotidyltransferase chain/domain
LVTPNRGEAAFFTGSPVSRTLSEVAAQARLLSRRWHTTVAVTLGASGALVVRGDGPPLVIPVPAPVAAGTDVCGAGDRLAVTAVELRASGSVFSEAVTAAVAAASTFVSEGGAGAIRVDPERESRVVADVREAEGDGLAAAKAVVQRVRDAGGTVVVTGGCFDLLHAGHTMTLEAARALGDCLIVCVNSDRSVRELKGEGRPVVGQADRVRLLQALACVDAVTVFDELTPVRVLEELHPDLFVKGGDYGVGDLPEATVLSQWGGEAVVVPYLHGRSSTALMKGAARRGSDG